MKKIIKKYFFGWLDGVEPYCSKVDKFLASVIYIGLAITIVLVLAEVHG